MGFVDTLIYSERTGIRILRHTLFWGVDIANYLIVISISREINAVEVYRILFMIPLIMLAAYFILYYLIPLYSKERNKGNLALWVLAILFYLGIFVHYYRYYILDPLIDPSLKPAFNVWDFRRIVGEILSAAMVISMAVAIKLIKNKIELQQKNDQLLHEKKTAELNFLKAQMHPHFLFNTLNTLYSETIQDSGKAQQIVLCLSDLLRFILEECNKPVISLSKEIKVIQDFIQLEKLRHGNRLNVDLKIKDADPKALISPLIFLPFVENSFKHTLSSLRGNIFITILIQGEGDRIRFYIENELVPYAVNGSGYGTGVSNVQRQLELLYGNGFSLDVCTTSGKYAVTLQVPTTLNQTNGEPDVHNN